MGKGQELYKRAKEIIPGGTQLLSKRPEMYLPEYWPSYYRQAKGCQVTDLDGNNYFDMSYMGIGANVLGYAFDAVDDAAIDAIKNGGMCTLNAPEEVILAEKMLALHPWADMVRYAKAGGEGMAVAVRIARAHTKKDIVLFCGYHGWHDWYLAANVTAADALDAHHLTGLDPAGVPQGLYGTNLPFHYNDIDEFYALCEKHKGEIAAVVMEPIRNDYPAQGFLEGIRSYTQDNEIVLIFDEVTAGFRIACGGSHLQLGVAPDMAVFGKAIANGYPITAIIGGQDVMKAAQDSFISSTFWTERVGFAAAVAMIDYFEQHHVETHLESVGQAVQAQWLKQAQKYGIKIEVGGILPLSHFSFEVDKPLVYKTFFTQEMLKKGFLATTALYASYAHTPEILDQYFTAVGEVFAMIHDAVSQGQDLESLLEGPVCHSGFQRLN